MTFRDLYSKHETTAYFISSSFFFRVNSVLDFVSLSLLSFEVYFLFHIELTFNSTCVLNSLNIGIERKVWKSRIIKFLLEKFLNVMRLDLRLVGRRNFFGLGKF